jgi:hypothetical protein
MLVAVLAALAFSCAEGDEAGGKGDGPSRDTSVDHGDAPDAAPVVAATGGAGGSGGEIDAGGGGGTAGGGEGGTTGTEAGFLEGELPPEMPDADATPVEPGAEPAPEPSDKPDAEVSPPLLTPRDLLGGHLELWLVGDRGVTCAPYGSGNRVTEWQDQSGRGKHAHPPAAKRGPLCGANAGTINQRTVITFPRTLDAMAEEHLEVDLGALASETLDVPFTIGLVERRSGTNYNSWALGAKLPNPMATQCDAPNPNRGRAFALGYSFPVALAVTTWGINCDFEVAVPVPGDEPSYTMVVYAPGNGMTVYVNGAEKASGPAAGLVQLQALIGRGWELSTIADSRYRGEIGEIFAYSAVAQEDDRKALLTYVKQQWNLKSP